MKMHTAIAMEPLCLQVAHKVFKANCLTVALSIVGSSVLKEIKRRLTTAAIMKILRLVFATSKDS